MNADEFSNVSVFFKDSDQTQPIYYKFKSFSIKHLPEMTQYIDSLQQHGQLSQNATYQSYIKNKTFSIPNDFPTAKSVIIIAVYTKLAFANFIYMGKVHEILIPPQYYKAHFDITDIETLLKTQILEGKECIFQRAASVLLKSAAVRSGLGKYGRNNICYVDEMGTCITLYGFFTDDEHLPDNWGEMSSLAQCGQCTFCLKNCPTQAIQAENFVIDAGRCVTLYNEIKGEFPDWISPQDHNALFGCMKCQLKCPANVKAMKSRLFLGTITDDETKMLLSGNPQEPHISSLANKLRMFNSEEAAEIIPTISRNLQVLLR